MSSRMPSPHSPPVREDPLYSTSGSTPRPGGYRLNLGLGVCRDEPGLVRRPAAVQQAASRVARAEPVQSEVPVLGDPAFRMLAWRLLLGEDGTRFEPEAVTMQTLGGTGALSLAGQLVKELNGGETTIWLPDPSWSSHPRIFEATGARIRRYRYYCKSESRLDRAAMFDTLDHLGPRDVVLLQACGHNPTGRDLDSQDWLQVIQLAASRGWLPMVDVAYAGLGRSLEEDLLGVRGLIRLGLPTVVAMSFSKNMGIYGLGSLHAVGLGKLPSMYRWMQQRAESLYAQPPRFDSAVASELISSSDLLQAWTDELKGLRQNVALVRSRFADGMAIATETTAFEHLREGGAGFFGLTGFDREAVARLGSKGIMLPQDGRLNFGSATPSDLPFMTRAMGEVYHEQRSRPS